MSDWQWLDVNTFYDHTKGLWVCMISIRIPEEYGVRHLHLHRNYGTTEYEAERNAVLHAKDVFHALDEESWAAVRKVTS